MKRAPDQVKEERSTKRKPIEPIADHEYVLLGEANNVSNLVPEISSYNPAYWWICVCGSTTQRQHQKDYCCPCNHKIEETPWRLVKMTNAFDTNLSHPKNTIPHLQRMLLRDPSNGLKIVSPSILAPCVDLCACMHLYQTAIQEIHYIPKELWPVIHKYFMGRMHPTLNQ